MQYFLDQYLGRMIDSGIRKIFFESGSSIAYLSKAFIDRLNKQEFLSIEADNLYIQTNNILTFLDFILFERVRVELFPYGPPEPKYGATFGPLTKAPVWEPPRDLRRLKSSATKFVDEIREYIKQRYENSGILLTATSGVEISPKSKFPGPHTGSYYNKLFKRAILTSNCPSVMFLDESKISREFEIGLCYSIFDKDVTWQKFCEKAPLAFAVAAKSEEKINEIEELLKPLGFTNIEKAPNSDKTIWNIIASNQLFQSCFET